MSYHLNIPLKILAALFISILLGYIFPVKVFLLLVGLFIFISFFVVLFYNNLTAGLIFTLALTLLFDFSGRVIISNLPDITPGRLGFLLLVSLFATKLVLKEQRLKYVDRVEWLMVLFYSFCLLSMWQAGTFLKFFGEFVSQFLLPFAYFFIAKNTFDSQNKVTHFFNFAFVVGVYASIVGILEHFGFDNILINPIAESYRASYSGDLRYITGILGLPAATGTLVSFCLIMSLYKSGESFSHWITSSVLKRLAIIPMVIAIFFSYQRSVYAGVLGALFVLLLFSRTLRRIAVVGLLLICALVIVNWSNVTSYDRSVGGVADPSNIYFRIAMAKTSLAIFADYPIMGTGFGTYQDYADKYLTKVEGGISYRGVEESGQHNTFLGILSELGGIGILLFGLIFYFILKMAWVKYKMCPPGSSFRQVIAIFFGIGAIYFINANCFETRYFELINDFFFVLAGIIAAYTPANREKWF